MGSITTSGYYTFTSPSLSCGDVIAYGYFSSCSTDPVAVGTTVTRSSGGPWTIASVSGFPVPVPSSGASFGTSFTCLDSVLSGGISYVTIKSVQPANINTCTGVVVSPSYLESLKSSSVSSISDLDPVAMSAIFAFFFAGVVSTWFLGRMVSMVPEAIRKM